MIGFPNGPIRPEPSRPKRPTFLNAVVQRNYVDGHCLNKQTSLLPYIVFSTTLLSTRCWHQDLRHVLPAQRMNYDMQVELYFSHFQLECVPCKLCLTYTQFRWNSSYREYRVQYEGKVLLDTDSEQAHCLYRANFVETQLCNLTFFSNPIPATARFNPLNTKRRPLYLKTQFIPRSKHFSSRLQKPISLCCKWHKSLFVLR